MTSISVENAVVTNAGHTIDLSALPGKSINALLSRGLTHFLGSEQASKVKARKDKHLEDTKVEADEDTVAGWKAEFVTKAINALLEGTIGVRAAGQASVDPFEAMCEKIAKAEVLEILRANGIKIPKKDETVKFANGAEKSIEDMIASRLEKNGEAIEKAAKKELAEKAKKVAAAKAIADAATTKDADSLGL